MESTFHPPCTLERNVSPDTHILPFLTPCPLFSYSFSFLATYLETCVVPSSFVFRGLPLISEYVSFSEGDLNSIPMHRPHSMVVIVTL